MFANFVEIWHGDILSDELSCQTYLPLLDEYEKDKASTFSNTVLQKKYIKTRAVLRKILASYLNIEPQNLIIKTSEYGKPSLDDDSVFFNLSHKDNQFVLAVSNVGDIGVDLEQCKNRDSISRLAEKFFSEVEILYWHSLSDELKINMFYRFWVRKEAFVKAVGRGIVLGLNQCVINPDNQSRFLSIPEDYGLASNWKILDVPLNDSVCAVVTKDLKFEYKQTEWLR